MSSQEKQLGIEGLEARLNQSVVPMGVAAMSAHYAMPVERVVAKKAMTIKVVSPKVAAQSPAKTVKPAAKVVAKTVAKPAAKPVVKKPAVQTTSAVQAKTPASVTTTVPVTSEQTSTVSTTSTTVTTATQSTESVQPTQPAQPTQPVQQTQATQTPESTTAPTQTTSVTSSATTPSTDGPVSAPVTTPASPATTPAPDPLAPILAKLYGDDVHDDSATIQQLVDTAYAEGLTNITLPAGTFLLDRQIDLYGTGVTFSGQGDGTVLDVNNIYTGIPGGASGEGLSIRATLDATPLMIAQPVTGNTIVFSGNAPVRAGQELFLSNGLGSTALLESALHGNDTAPGAFRELGPDEYVQIASVTVDANGNTVATLTKNVIGTGQYGNVAPSGLSSIDYLHASSIDRPADGLTVQNLAIEFKKTGADMSIVTEFANNLTLNHIHVLNATTAGGLGGIGTNESTNLLIENVTGPIGIGLNTTRLATVTNNTVLSVMMEEASTDNLITQNTLTGTTSCDIRINDMACARNTISYNNIHGGTVNTGAIAIAEGTDTTIANNTIHDGHASIWLGITSGAEVLNNIADAFGNYQPLSTIISSGNSWQS